MTESIVILAAGVNRRMRIQYPKCLYKIKDNCILEYQLKILNRFKIPISIVGGYKSKLIKNHIKSTGCEIGFILNQNYYSNVASSLILAAKNIKTDRLLVVYGDLLFTKKSIKKILKSVNSAIISSPYMNHDEVGIMTESGKLNHISFGLPVKWGHVTLYTGKELDILKTMDEKSHERLFGFEIINKIIDSGGRFNVIPGLSVDIDTKKDAKIINHDEYLSSLFLE